MTLGKTVTLPLGRVVTDIGPGQVVVAGGETITDEGLRRVQDKDGNVILVIQRVIEELPETLHRDSFIYKP